MKAFVSWSGGKDCLLAAHRFVKACSDNKLECLINMCDDENEKSRSHGILKSLIGLQANRMNLPIIQKVTNISNYEKNFKEAISDAKNIGIEAGIFGDIHLQEHRTWIERVCGEMNIKAIFPLWGEETIDLLREFVNKGYKTIVVAVDNQKLGAEWLGRNIDDEFIRDISLLDNIDPCAENGEYHSFVYAGGLFSSDIFFQKGMKYDDGKTTFLEIIENTI